MVISIIGILVGLLLPAINSAREAGRRAQCQSNMHNVVLAILGYVTTKNVFPPAGVFGEDHYRHRLPGRSVGGCRCRLDARATKSGPTGTAGSAGIGLRCIAGSCRSSRTWTARNCTTSGRMLRPRPPKESRPRAYLDPGFGVTANGITGT